MKFNISTIIPLTLLFSSAVVSKNVFVMPKFTDQELQNAVNEIDAKKNSQKAFSIKGLEGSHIIEKRNGKNIFDYKLIIDDDGLTKRNAKNVFDLKLTIDDDKLNKREAKNVFNLNLIIDDKISKREIEDNCQFNIYLESIPLPDDFFDDIKDISFDLSNIEYIVSSSRFDGNTIDFNLNKVDGLNYKNLNDNKRISIGVPKKISVNNISSNHEFVIPESVKNKGTDMGSTVMPPIQNADIATALTQREDLRIFSSYMRDLVDLYKKCEVADEPVVDEINSDNYSQLLIFAPTNDAMVNLELKPWEFPASVDDSSDNDLQLDETIQKNIRHFVESHVVETRNLSLTGRKVVEFKSINNNAIFLKNSETSFQIKLLGSNEWLNIENIEVLKNGAILTIGKTLSWPGRN